jgi:hypothetical protein
VTNQTDIFALHTHRAVFTEVCTALYERELHQLAQTSLTDVKQLKRKVDSLPILIKRAAEFLIRTDLPLTLDTHNASWQYKQNNRPPIKSNASEKNHQWISQNRQLGLVLPVFIESMGEIHFELDSIDKIMPEESQLHLNKNGWFHFDGSMVETASLAKHSQKFICKPTKSTLCAACCGHVWRFKGKGQPRTLTLRELLLSGSLNWRAPLTLFAPISIPPKNT